MTEKEKAKAYEEAIERTKKLYSKGITEEIFPELKEDDTDRIKKNCIHFLELQKQHHAATFEIEECIDWLEKQGKNSTDKIEHRFNVGDWVVFITSGSIYQVEKKENYEYTLKNIHGGSLCLCFSIEQLIREWTIQDAKDGDVLVHSSFMFGDLIFIYNNTSILQAYCYYSNERNRFIIEDRGHPCPWNMQEVTPATKEQRDLLFQKIKEAGYEWDSEKKELKKLDLVPNKKPILGGLNMKTYNDVNIGDTVYIWGSGDSSVDETTITEKHDDRGHWNLKFSNGCVGRALKNGTSSTMGMYACLVYSDKEAVRESINERIKILSNIKI